MTSSFKVNKLYSLPSRFTEQKARQAGGGAWCFFLQRAHRKSSTTHCFSSAIEWEVEKVHHTVTQSVSFQFASAGMMESKRCFRQLRLKKMATLGKTSSRQICLDGKHQTGKLGFIKGNHCASLHFWCSNECHPDWMQTIPWIVCQIGSTFGAIGFLQPTVQSITVNNEFWPQFWYPGNRAVLGNMKNIFLDTG